jgi:hypothetical protein
MDDGQGNSAADFRATWAHDGPEMVAVPNRPFEEGTIHIQASRVEFEDRKHSAAHDTKFYMDMFAELDRYYKEVSNGKVGVKVSLSEWLLLPRSWRTTQTTNQE